MDSLDTSFLATAAPAQAEEATAEVGATEMSTEETSEVQSDIQTAGSEQEQAPDTAAGEVPGGDSESEEINEEELQKLMADERAPKWYRDQLKKVSGYSAKLREERDAAQRQYDEYKTQYESSQIPETDLERLRLAEERQYKLSSFQTSAEEILGSLQEIVPQQKIAEVKSHLAWEFLETPDGKPDLDNLQVIIDRYTGYKEGDTRVNAKDLIGAMDALKRGTISSADLQEFSSDAEYEAFKKAQALEDQISQREQLARANAEFQETQTRTSLLQNVGRSIQSQFQPKVEALLQKFQLVPVEGEPKVSADMKVAIQQKLAAVIADAQAKSAHIGDVWKGMEMLQKATGATPDKIQAEINAFTSSFPYQTALNKGLGELMQAVERTITQEAYIYSLAMEGYKARAAKGQESREVIGSPRQTEVLNQYTPEQLAAMSARERRQAQLKQVSDSIRESMKTTNRWGQ